jgi:hypothetical protein
MDSILHRTISRFRFLKLLLMGMTGSNYARRYDNDGGTETTGTSLANFTQVSRTAIFHNLQICL